MGNKLSTEICVVGNQKYRLKGTVPMSTQNKSLSIFDHLLKSTYILQIFETRVEQKLSTKICVLGNQRNRLNGTVPMSTQNKSLSIFHHVLKST